MVDYALDNDCNIGMIQEQSDGELYSVGCMGKITSCQKTPDGMYLINLLGQDCFKFKYEVKLKKMFRVAEVSVLSNRDKTQDLDLNKINIQKLLIEYQQFMVSKGLEVNLNFFEKIEKINIIKFIAMTVPFSSAEKQMLLETMSFKDLFEKLITLFQYYNLAISKSIN